jgi:hypothetical protein
MKEEQYLKDKAFCEDELDYISKQLIYLQNLTKVVKSCLKYQNTENLFDFTHFNDEYNYIFEDILNKLNIKENEINMNNLEKLIIGIKNEIKSTKIVFKQLNLEYNKILIRIKKNNNR